MPISRRLKLRGAGTLCEGDFLYYKKVVSLIGVDSKTEIVY